MHPDVVAITSQMSQEDIDGLAAVITQQADARGIQLTPETIEGAILGAYHSDQWTEDGLGAHLEAQYEPAYEQTYEPPPEQYADRSYAEDVEQLRLERSGAQAEQDAREFEQRLGRPLTNREAQQLAEQQYAQAQRGGHLDTAAAAQAAGIKSYSEMNPGDVARTMAERVRELNGPNDDLEIPVRETGEMNGPAYEPDWSEMSPRQINQYLSARAQGAEMTFDENEQYE